MYPSTTRSESSFEAVKNPSASAVVPTVFAAAAVPLAVVGLLSYPAIGLAAAAFGAVAYRLLTTGRADRVRRPFRRRLADLVGRLDRPAAGNRGKSSCCEDAV